MRHNYDDNTAIAIQSFLQTSCKAWFNGNWQQEKAWVIQEGRRQGRWKAKSEGGLQLLVMSSRDAQEKNEAIITQRFYCTE